MLTAEVERTQAVDVNMYSANKTQTQNVGTEFKLH